MRYFIVIMAIAGLLGFNVMSAHALTATTDDGRKVILNSDGTWKYASTEKAKTGITGPEWSKPDNATKVLKGKAGFYELWYDPNKWTLETNSPNAVVEYYLINSNNEGQAMVISERIPLALETLKKAAIENAKRNAPDLKVLDEESITVNGQRGLKMKMFGTVNGIAFAYYGFYWTGKAGALQVVTFTTQNLFAEFRPAFEELLSGVVITNP